MKDNEKSTFREWEKYLRDLPEQLQSLVTMRLQAFLSACLQQEININTVNKTELVKVFACSEFVARSLINNPAILTQLLNENSLQNDINTQQIHYQISQLLSLCKDDVQLAQRLRDFRRKAWIRIAWRDICGHAKVEQTLSELSAYADSIIEALTTYLHKQFTTQYGIPYTSSGREQSLVVLALGKLGGRELNFSSDVDLIFCYQENGYFDNDNSRDYDAYFRRFGQRLIQLLNERNEDGFLFRVDMRLRPYGDSGPLLMSFNAMEDYYQHQGRDWERYAMIKARVIAGDREAGQSILQMLQPFVYRRYLDYDAFDSLRNMKLMIMREVQRKNNESNLKVGLGGIREVEFIGQAFQLVRGGRNPILQSTGLLTVLVKLKQLKLLSDHIVQQLIDDYLFLRRCENLVQAIDEQQQHSLPDNELLQQRLLVATPYTSWQQLQDAVSACRARIHEQFKQIFKSEQSEDSCSDNDQLLLLWNNKLAQPEALSLLSSLGFHDAETILLRLTQFQQSRAYRIASERTVKRLEKLIVIILNELAGWDNPDDCFQRVLTLIEAIIGRSAYLALLIENKSVIPLLLRLMAISPWISAYLARHPLLLDELLDVRALYTPADKKVLAQDLSRRLSALDMDDLEQQMEVLRQFKHAQVLRVAAADIADAIPLMVVSDYLTHIAEVILEAVFNIAWYQLISKYGRPCISGSDTPINQSGFVIVAYGKLGGIELGYGSDLDIIFLHSAATDNGQTLGPTKIENKVFYVRLAQRVIHILTTRTAAGSLYEIDIRLRPNGAAGLLVSSIESFSEYQQSQAWTWEHQALVRARPVAGDLELGQQFNQVRHKILTQKRDFSVLLSDVRTMREKMLKHLGGKAANQFSLKQDRGGIADIEFIVQFFVLGYASKYPDLILYTDNIRQIDALNNNKLITQEQAELLSNAYREYRSRVHRLVLQEKEIIVDLDEYQNYRKSISQLWQDWIIDAKF